MARRIPGELDGRQRPEIVYLPDECGSVLSRDSSAWIDIEWVGTRGDHRVDRPTSEVLASLSIDRPHERVDGADSTKSVSRVVGRPQPAVSNPVNLFLHDRSPHLGIAIPKMAVRACEDRHMVARGDPVFGKLVRTELHAVLGTAGVVVDEDEVHRSVGSAGSIEVR